MTNCPICNGKVEYKTRPTTYTYKEHSIEVEQSGEYCLECKVELQKAKDKYNNHISEHAEIFIKHGA